jgi:hypothetical protein
MRMGSDQEEVKMTAKYLFNILAADFTMQIQRNSSQDTSA